MHKFNFSYIAEVIKVLLLLPCNNRPCEMRTYFIAT